MTCTVKLNGTQLKQILIKLEKLPTLRVSYKGDQLRVESSAQDEADAIMWEALAQPQQQGLFAL